MRDTIFCKHFRSMGEHDTCEAGVAYGSLTSIPFDQRPCFMRDGRVCPGCDKQEFPAPEEIAAEDAEFAALFQRIDTARAAIVEHCGGPWKRGKSGARGAINCPICKGENTLQFSVSGFNGHIHAGCTTEGCVRWME